MAERPDATAMTAMENDLRALGSTIAYPTVSTDFAAGVVAAIGREEAGLPWWRRLFAFAAGPHRPVGARPLRRALVLAVILLLVIAALTAAIGLGVPGVRIFLGSAPTAIPARPSGSPPSGSSHPAASVPLGATIGFGTLTPMDQVEAETGFKPRLPAGVGQPATAYVHDRRLAMVWPATPQLPQILEPGIGLVVTEFNGRIDPGYYAKMTNGGTLVEAVRVGGQRGFWLTGEAHVLWYVDANGNQIDEPPRRVGQALIWADDELTYRIETSLPRDEAIRLAESMR